MKVWQIYAKGNGRQRREGGEDKAETKAMEKCFIIEPVIMKLPEMIASERAIKNQIISRSSRVILSIFPDKIAIKRAYARAR